MIRQIGRAPTASDGPGFYEWNETLYMVNMAGNVSSFYWTGVSAVVAHLKSNSGSGVTADAELIERIIANYNDTILKAIAITKKPDVINGMALSKALG